MTNVLQQNILFFVNTFVEDACIVFDFSKYSIYFLPLSLPSITL
jgi:hypothetical protein